MGLGDVVGARREHVEDEPAARYEQLPRCTQGPQPLLVVQQVEVRAKRTGDQAHPLLDWRVREVSEPQIQELRHPRELGSLAADLEHSRRRVDPDHADPCRGGGDGDPPCPDRELDDRPARAPGLAYVEGDVLGDAPAPRVVEPRDRVVKARHAGLRATHTCSSLRSSYGRRSNQP